MAKITLHSDSKNSATSVSNVFIDEYMSGANGEFVKVYLYLLRQLSAPDATFSLSSLADKFEHTEKDIKRALCYWERMHLLRLEYDANANLTGVRLLDTVSNSDASKASSNNGSGDNTISDDNLSATPTSMKSESSEATLELTRDITSDSLQLSTPERKNYSADDIQNFRQEEAIAELFFISERYLGRTLTSTDIQTILYWYDVLGFSANLIEYLVEYCVSKGHTSIRYMEKVALAWKDSNVTTVEQAKIASGAHSQLYFAVMKALGISGRNLVPSETAYIDKWKKEFNFSQEVITLACQKTIQAIHQPSFEYTDTILSNWKKKNVITIEDISRLDEAFQQRKKSTSPAPQTASNRNKFNNFEQRSYDYDELEKMLLTTSVR